jgi:glycosyltransferase involved in cell wall biosynthesis
MKKILLILHTPPPYGGGEIQAQNIKNYFSGWENYYIYDYSRKSHSRSGWNSLFDIRAFFAGIWWVIKVIYLLSNLKPDKIYFTLPKSFMAFMRNAMVIPVAKVLRTRILGELPGTSFLFLDKGKGVRYTTGLFFLRKIDEIRFLSPGISGLHNKYNLRKHVIIENGIQTSDNFIVEANVFKSPVLKLLYIGSIERSKGIFNSLQALKICTDEGISLHFHLVGYWTNPDEEKEALNFIHQNRLEKVITFHGILMGSSKWEIFTDCAILVHPTYWDGVPLSILEALSLGLPVISTNVGGIPDTIKDGINGTILYENNPQILSQAITFYYCNRQILPIISEANKNLFKERFDLPIFLQNMGKWFAE